MISSYLRNYPIRDFPWRAEGLTPYQLLITEIMLRKTSSTHVVKVWEEFFERFPDQRTLAEASREELREILHPLGLQNTRSELVMRMGREDLGRMSKIDGVGQYIAGSVILQSGGLAFPHDVNIERLMCRYFGAVKFRDVEKEYRKELGASVDRRRFFYQLLDLSQTHCLPTAPRCGSCPLESTCKFRSCALELDEGRFPVVVVTREEWLELKSSSILLNATQSSGSRQGLAYVQTPTLAFVAVVRVDFRKRFTRVRMIRQLGRQVSLKEIRNVYREFRPRRPVMQVSESLRKVVLKISQQGLPW